MYVAYLSTVLSNLRYRWVKLAKKVLSEREGDKHNSIIPTMNRCRWHPSCCWVIGWRKTPDTVQANHSVHPHWCLCNEVYCSTG